MTGHGEKEVRKSSFWVSSSVKRELGACEVPGWVRTLAGQAGGPPFKFSVPTLKTKSKIIGHGSTSVCNPSAVAGRDRKIPRFAGHQPCSPPDFQVKCEPRPRRNKRRVMGTKTLELPSGLGTDIAARLHSNTYHTPWGHGGRQSKLHAICTLLGRSRLFSGGGTHSPRPADSCRQEI